ncbi:MAG: hypothetical protein ABLT11_11645 [Candidatus Acidiferrum sp.]
MPDSSLILCDGCGQPASPEHIARRLQRLESTTRYRPIHLHTLLLGAVSPAKDAEFFYSPGEAHSGEAAHLFAAAGIAPENKNTDAMHSEFQRRGLFVTHVLECPLDAASGAATPESAVAERLAALFTRIRRSLKPKRIAFISGSLTPLISKFDSAQLGCELVVNQGHAFALDSSDLAALSVTVTRLRESLAVPAAR